MEVLGYGSHAITEHFDSNQGFTFVVFITLFIYMAALSLSKPNEVEQNYGVASLILATLMLIKFRSRKLSEIYVFFQSYIHFLKIFLNLLENL